ncbi:MAG: serine hydrolase domain-containing protein [Salinimicrobium sediminis]|nr:serine hydrolase domain-containing protein [Salinimicrobium sediminis]
MKSCFYLFLFVLLLAGCDPTDDKIEENLTGSEIFESLDEKIQKLLDDHNVSGAQLAIVRDEKLVYSQSYGFANLEESIPVTSQSRFRIASISKPITAVAILKLKEQGLLDLDDPVFGVGAILGTTYGNKPYGEDIKKITVKHLLEHRSGWTNTPNDPMFANLNFTHAQLIGDVLDNRSLTNAPGSTEFYSNFGYSVLGRVIEAVTNKPYSTYVKHEILTPAGITNMEIGGNTYSERLMNEVKYYTQENFDPYQMNVSRMDSHGGWIASAEDLVKLLVRIDRKLSKPDILSNSSLQELYFGYQYWYFFGSLPGTSTVLSRVNDRTGYALLLNSRTLPPNGILEEMNSIVRNELISIPNWPNQDLFK